MTFRDKVRRALGRSLRPQDDGKQKIEYYRRGEAPRSKYRGPIDPEHRRQLYAWNFAAATVERNRSFDLNLSPCSSLPDNGNCNNGEEAMNPSPFGDRSPRLLIGRGGSISVAHHEVAPSGSLDSSPPSTLIDSESNTSSYLTLKDSLYWSINQQDLVANSVKGTIIDIPDPLSRPSPELEKPLRVVPLEAALAPAHIY